MRLAVAGKGGAGKTTFCATAARLLARAGHRVVAIDGDTNPNLHAAMGVDAEAAARAQSLPTSLVSRRFDGPRLTAPLDEVLDRHALDAPDGVRLIRMGVPQHADEGCLCSAHAAVSAVLADLGAEPDTVAVLDLEASPEHLSRGTARHADALLLVAEPYFRSLEAVRLQASLAAETAIERVAVVANKCRTTTDVEAIDEFCANHRLELVGHMPWSDAVLDADAASHPLLDHEPADPLIDAIAAVAGRLVQPVKPQEVGS
ncbi:MAG: AAA family ATPase [Acidimicrobiia bacterium]|nr:AAA family ATPase [Acidimicrobiia bacterium]